MWPFNLLWSPSNDPPEALGEADRPAKQVRFRPYANVRNIPSDDALPLALILRPATGGPAKARGRPTSLPRPQDRVSPRIEEVPSTGTSDSERGSDTSSDASPKRAFQPVPRSPRAPRQASRLGPGPLVDPIGAQCDDALPTHMEGVKECPDSMVGLKHVRIPTPFPPHAPEDMMLGALVTDYLNLHGWCPTCCRKVVGVHLGAIREGDVFAAVMQRLGMDWSHARFLFNADKVERDCMIY